MLVQGRSAMGMGALGEGECTISLIGAPRDKGRLLLASFLYQSWALFTGTCDEFRPLTFRVTNAARNSKEIVRRVFSWFGKTGG